MWPDGARCAASFTFDFDAEEVWIGENPDKRAPPWGAPAAREPRMWASAPARLTDDPVTGRDYLETGLPLRCLGDGPCGAEDVDRRREPLYRPVPGTGLRRLPGEAVAGCAGRRPGRPGRGVSISVGFLA